MRYAAAVIVLGVALSGALALHRWQPTHTVTVTVSCPNSAYSGCPALTTASISDFLATSNVKHSETAPAHWWWKDPAALLLLFVGVAGALAVVARRPLNAK